MVVYGRDAFWEMKQEGVALSNSGSGPIRRATDNSGQPRRASAVAHRLGGYWFDSRIRLECSAPSREASVVVGRFC